MRHALPFCLSKAFLSMPRTLNDNNRDAVTKNAMKQPFELMIHRGSQTSIRNTLHRRLFIVV